VYPDTLEIPAHTHRTIEICGFRIWLMRGHENWDEFGWTGTPCRRALVNGLRRFPAQKDQILQEFMLLNPDDQQGKLKFVTSYRQAN
jgi:hypothetical protein